MKKTRLALLMALVMMLSVILAACGGSGETKTFTVTFDSNGATTTVASQEIDEDDFALPPTPQPSRADSKFDGWYLGDVKFDFNQPITSDITLKAKWSFQVKFDPRGGSSIPGLDAGNITFIKEGEKLAGNYPTTRNNHTFDAWYLNDAKFDFNIPITAPITLNAVWIEDAKVIVTFDSAGGSQVPAGYAYSGETVTKPADPTKGADKFLGWFLNGVAFNFSTLINEPITLVAQWESAIEIANAAQLKAIGSSAATMNMNYKLVADINLSAETNWCAIGRVASGDGRNVTPFGGVLDGQGYKITMPSSGYFANSSGYVEDFGLFKVNEGIIQNLWISGTCDGVGAWGGGLVVDNNGIIRNCFFDINLTSISAGAIDQGPASATVNVAFASAICVNNRGTISNVIGIGIIDCRGSMPTWGDLISGLLICNNTGESSQIYALGNPATDRVSGWDPETSSLVKTQTELQAASLYATWDTSVWNIVNGQYPSLKRPA